MQIMTRPHAQVIVCLPKEEPEVMARERGRQYEQKIRNTLPEMSKHVAGISVPRDANQLWLAMALIK